MIDTAAKIKGVMLKPIPLSFPEKNASEVAAALGVSEARMNRIFAIVEETHKSAPSRETALRPRSKTTKSARQNPRHRKQVNGKTAR